MMTDDDDEAMPLWLSHLRELEPDQARAERVGARCREMIVRRQRHAESSARPDRLTAVVLQPWLVSGLCLCYLLGVVYDVIRLRSLP
ncbi:MAG: hypothetical protein ABMA15_12940 [Vicinamibacterales bacterium]